MNEVVPEFIFSMETPSGSFNNTMRVTAETLDEVLENFELFLKGCGFSTKGTLCFLDEKMLPTEEHSEYYYDFSRNR